MQETELAELVAWTEGTSRAVECDDVHEVDSDGEEVVAVMPSYPTVSQAAAAARGKQEGPSPHARVSLIERLSVFPYGLLVLI